MKGAGPSSGGLDAATLFGDVEAQEGALQGRFGAGDVGIFLRTFEATFRPASGCAGPLDIDFGCALGGVHHDSDARGRRFEKPAMRGKAVFVAACANSRLADPQCGDEIRMIRFDAEVSAFAGCDDKGGVVGLKEDPVGRQDLNRQVHRVDSPERPALHGGSALRSDKRGG